MLLLLVGCYPAPEPPPRFQPGQPLYEQYTTPGKRMVVQSPDGPSMKVRARRSTLRVYDDAMRPLGRVRADGAPDAEDDARPLITLLPLGEAPRQVEQLSPDVVALEGRWRLERADAGWDLFGADGDLLYLWRRLPDADDGDAPRWVARHHYGAAQVLTIEDDGPHRHLLSPRGERLFTFPAATDDLPILAYSVTAIPALDRAALALFVSSGLN